MPLKERSQGVTTDNIRFLRMRFFKPDGLFKRFFRYKRESRFSLQMPCRKKLFLCFLRRRRNIQVAVLENMIT